MLFMTCLDYSSVKMKVTLIAALLAYTAMASQQATQMRAVSQTDALQNMIMTEVSNLCASKVYRKKC